MEQTLTNLHKENFDLKLEVFHRREKQTSLEERCESLEAEKAELESDKRNLQGEKHELEEINDKLMSELEMRDKAVEEAVAMIVSLEARMEELLQEREMMMMQQAEKEQQFFATDARLREALSTAFDQVNNQPRSKPVNISTSSRASNANNANNANHSHDPETTPKYMKPHASMKIVDDFTHTINRMPSFVSDRSELTENLRNVYLGTRAGSSIASLSHDHFQSMDGAESDLRDARIGSPALSVLSESSFLSIYGKKELPPMSINISSAPARNINRRVSQIACVPDIRRSMPENALNAPSIDVSMTSSMDSNGSGETCVDDNMDHATGSAANVVAHALASTNQHPQSHERSTTPRKRSTASEFLGTNSPLQRIEQLDKCKQDKKDILRRVRTDAPFLSHNQNGQHNLPPTPDTISTSTLRRYKNSSETLANSRSTSGDQRMSAIESYVDSIPARVPSTIAFGRYHENNKAHSSYYDSQLYIPPRPRSAGETTVSHHGRGSVWDSESSDGEDMDLDGNDSASLQDYWLRESLRPSGQAPPAHRHRSRSRRTGSGTFSNGRISPDLFGFPTTSNGWATTAMFGSLHGNGYNGPNGYGGSNNNNNSYSYRNAPFAQTLDALGDSLPAPAAGIFGPSGLLASPLPYGLNNSSPTGPPPPPHRRSSLHAHTGSSRSGSRHGTAPGTPSMSTPIIGSGVMSSASKQSRRSPTRPQTRTGTMTTTTSSEDRSTTAAPAAAAAVDVSNAKQRHYPPASGGNTASRNRVLSLFRRSGSHEVASAAQSPQAAQAPQSAEPPADTTSSTTGSIGVPSRVRGEDELSGNNSLGLSLNAGVGASATPPPIMRNPRNPARGSVDSGTAQASTSEGGPDAAAEAKDVAEVQAAPQEAAAAATAAAPTAASGQRMKWLGRVTSLRNRTG